MQSALKHHGSYTGDARLYRDSRKHIPLRLERQEEDDLSIFMMELYQDLLPSKDSHQKRIQLTKKIEQILHNEWPDYNMQVCIFGSSVNNLGTSNSDVDLCITSPCIGFPDVRVLATLFQNYNMRNIVCVPGAKVPIVRFFDPEFQLACDININNTIALENTKMVKTYVALDHRIRPLIMIIKHWTKQRDLNNAAYGGTLSSYAWTCMIINFLQTRSPPILPSLHGGRERFSEDIDRFYDYGAKNKETLGGLFFAFFRRFAIEFDYYTQVLSVHQGKILSKSQKGWGVGHNRVCLCVEEPFNLTRNLGNTADPASVRGIRVECHRVISLLVWEKVGFNCLFDPYFSMRFSSYPRHHIQAPLLQQTVLYNTQIYSHPPFVNPNNNKLIQRQQAAYGNYKTPHQNTLIDIGNEGNYHNIPSTLLTMLNLTDNYSHDHSVDSIFARYHREVLEDNDKRRASKNLKKKHSIATKDEPILKDECRRNEISDQEVNTEQKKINRLTQEQRQQHSQQIQYKKQSHQNQKQERKENEEKQTQHEKQRQEKAYSSTAGRYRRGSMSKRRHQQEQKDNKEKSATTTTVELNTKQQSRKATKDDHSIIENNPTTKYKSHKRKNKQRRK
ncbi:hypothetical protein K501DRAFT_263396, partial [Backusella circina FSU 941]